MPTLARFVKTVLIVALVGYGIVSALANLVEPRTRAMREPIDSRIIREAGKPAAPGS